MVVEFLGLSLFNDTMAKMNTTYIPIFMYNVL